MIRRGLVEIVVEKPPQTQAVGHAPGDPSLAIDAFEESDQQQVEVHAGSQRQTANLGGIELGAPLLAELVEARRPQHPLQSLIKRMSWWDTDAFSRIEKHLLLRFRSFPAHRHTQSYVCSYCLGIPSVRTLDTGCYPFL